MRRITIYLFISLRYRWTVWGSKPGRSTRLFPLRNVRTSSGAHPESYTMAWGFFPGEDAASSKIFVTLHTSHHPTLQHHNNYNRTENHRQWNAVRPPDDGRKDALNMLRNNWLPINHYLLHLVGLPFIYTHFKFNHSSPKITHFMRCWKTRYGKTGHTWQYTGLFISPSGISDPCGTVAGTVTSKGTMSTEGQTLQVSVLPYRCSICAPLVTRHALQRVSQELDYRIDICRVTKGALIEHL
jgi:hypothetical protein